MRCWRFGAGASVGGGCLGSSGSLDGLAFGAVPDCNRFSRGGGWNLINQAGLFTGQRVMCIST